MKIGLPGAVRRPLARKCRYRRTRIFDATDQTAQARLSPSELLISDDQLQQLGGLRRVQAYDSYAFLLDQAVHTLRDHFKVQSLDGFGCAGMDPALVTRLTNSPAVDVVRLDDDGGCRSRRRRTR